MNHLADIRLLQDSGLLDDFIFQPSAEKDWVARMEDSQDRAAQVCIFETAKAMMALLATYPIQGIHPQWKVDGTQLGMVFHIEREGEGRDRFTVMGGDYHLRWTDAVDNSAVWQEAMVALDDTCQPSLLRCERQLNAAFPHLMTMELLAQAIGTHAVEVQALWEQARLQQDTPPAQASKVLRRP